MGRRQNQAIETILSNPALEDLLGFSGGLLDKMLAEDSWAKGFPFVSLALYGAKKAVKIHDKEKAFSNALEIAFIVSLDKALRFLQYSQCLDYRNLKILKKEGGIHLSEFSWDNLEIQDASKSLQTHYRVQFSASIPDDIWEKVKSFILRHWQLHFWKQVEGFPVRYEALKEAMESQSFLQEKKLWAEQLYFESLTQPFYETMPLERERGLSLSQLYVPPRWALFKKEWAPKKTWRQENLYSHERGRKTITGRNRILQSPEGRLHSYNS